MNQNEEEEITTEETPTKGKKRNSRYFGYACVRSYELQSRLKRNVLSIDYMLDISFSSEVTCPIHHSTTCKCSRLEDEMCWVSNEHGRLALKLFLKHLEGDSLQAFKRLVISNMDRLDEIKELAAGHPKLLEKIKMLAVFS